MSEAQAQSMTADQVQQASSLYREDFEAVRSQVAKAVVGQREVIEQTLVCLFVGGHALLEGVPGIGKTLLVRSISEAVDLSFGRVQFTPDLMPADITGTTVIDESEDEQGRMRRSFRFQPGPVFSQILLADEINRATPKTQSALLEAMQERSVTVGGTTHALPAPFFVLATQNPVEQEGTYPLPEAQLDRFLFKLLVGYPSRDEEVEVLRRHHRGLDPHDPLASGVQMVANAGSLAAARVEVSKVTVSEPVLAYLVDLTRATRVAPSLELGVSPRGATALLKASKAWAWLSNREFVTPDEVKAMAKPTLRHRVRVRPELEIEGLTADDVLDGILAQVPAP